MAEAPWYRRGGPDGAAGRLVLTEASGLVLLGPYLPMLFERLGVLRAGEELDAAMALELLQRVLAADLPERTDGRALERLLCGLPVEGEPMPAPRALEPEAAALVDGLLEAVIARWSTLGNTSVEGLREAFLRRPGIVRATGAGWRLEVEPRAWDMLLDRLPWSIAVQKFSWMPAPIAVSWRT